jgi:hypothetical protein
MNYAWICVDSFELVYDLNTICEINKIWCLIIWLFDYWIIKLVSNLRGVYIVVKIAWLNAFLCFAEYGL